MENEKLDEAIVHFTEAIEHFTTCGEEPDSRFVCQLVCLSVSLSVRVSACLFVCQLVCLSVTLNSMYFNSLLEFVK